MSDKLPACRAFTKGSSIKAHDKLTACRTSGTDRSNQVTPDYRDVTKTLIIPAPSFNGSNAVRFFFHAENCLFVRQRLRDRTADEVMSRGVQLPDLFEALPVKEAQREFQRELATVRSLCLTLLAEKQLAA